MRHFSRSHGKHCYLRSFKTKCKKCGAEVLYWECTHGSKVFFEYPPYGKLIKHICRKSRQKNKKNKYPVEIKTPKGLLVDPMRKCPACGKLFKNEKRLNDHIEEMNKFDLFHQILKYRPENLDKAEKLDNQKLEFGKINIKAKEE